MADVRYAPMPYTHIKPAVSETPETSSLLLESRPRGLRTGAVLFPTAFLRVRCCYLSLKRVQWQSTVNTNWFVEPDRMNTGENNR